MWTHLLNFDNFYNFRNFINITWFIFVTILIQRTQYNSPFFPLGFYINSKQSLHLSMEIMKTKLWHKDNITITTAPLIALILACKLMASPLSPPNNLVAAFILVHCCSTLSFAYLTSKHVPPFLCYPSGNFILLSYYVFVNTIENTFPKQRVSLAELSRCRAAAPAAKLQLARPAHPRGAFLPYRRNFLVKQKTGPLPYAMILSSQIFYSIFFCYKYFLIISHPSSVAK